MYMSNTNKKEKKNMFTLSLLFSALLALNIAASRWGANSIDGIDSHEWQRRQDWPGFH